MNYINWNIPHTPILILYSSIFFLQISLACASLLPAVLPLRLVNPGNWPHSVVVQPAFKMRKIPPSKPNLHDNKQTLRWLINIFLFFYRLLELVEDCGPLPLANDKCKLDTEKTNKTAAFPYCCPIFTCEPGVKLEYPEAVKETTTKKE